ncbi:hypothetical protein ACP4OV_018260 [Aristida adscensionis]
MDGNKRGAQGVARQCVANSCARAVAVAVAVAEEQQYPRDESSMGAPRTSLTKSGENKPITIREEWCFCCIKLGSVFICIDS